MEMLLVPGGAFTNLDWWKSIAHKETLGLSLVLFVNLYKTGILSCVKMSAKGRWDGIMQQYHLRPHEVVVRVVEGVSTTTYTAYERVQAETHPLGSIVCTGGSIPKIELRNYGVRLNKHDFLLLGHSTKRDSDLELIGQYGNLFTLIFRVTLIKIGEGMKIGILSLLRRGKKVELITNGERLDFFLWSYTQGSRKQLAVSIVKLKGKDPSLKNDTTLTIQNSSISDIRVDRYLFLHPPDSSQTYTNGYGSILLNEAYCGKIFVRGIFVEDCSTCRRGLVYGINFQSVEISMGRDRRAVPHNAQTALAVYKIWESAICTGSEGASSRYLKLLLKNDTSFDVMEAENVVTKEVAKELLPALRDETPGNSFYYFHSESG